MQQSSKIHIKENALYVLILRMLVICKRNLPVDITNEAHTLIKYQFWTIQVLHIK